LGALGVRSLDPRGIPNQRGTMAKQTGLNHRHRDKSGQVHKKEGNTRVDTLRETYGGQFAAGIRGDAHLSTLLERTGHESLTDYLKTQKL